MIQKIQLFMVNLIANITTEVKIIGGLRFEKRKADYIDNNGPAPEGFFMYCDISKT